MNVFDWFFSKIFLKENYISSLNAEELIDDYIRSNPIEDSCKPHIDYNLVMDSIRIFWDCDADWYVDPLKENIDIELIKEFDTDRIVGVGIRNVQKALREGT
jgi:hypothetical protein